MVWEYNLGFSFIKEWEKWMNMNKNTNDMNVFSENELKEKLNETLTLVILNRW
jgi:hypothetical protein